ncbi:MAG: hypothetical protein IT381_02160 [Deltaproteobacteria bacterium]|nr:hypothetical protein [Deltaproteobacteria bacterium]
METATDLRATAAAVARGELSALSFLGLTAKDGEVFAGFAAALLNRGKTSKAAACAQLAVALAPGDGLAWLVLGCARARLGQDAAALAAYETAARLKPESARVWVDLAELALARLDHTTACAALRCALAVDPAGRTPAGARAQWIIARTVRELGGGSATERRASSQRGTPL